MTFAGLHNSRRFINNVHKAELSDPKVRSQHILGRIEMSTISQNLLANAFGELARCEFGCFR